jgi:sigma-E factor negative regulatory protein RseB
VTIPAPVAATLAMAAVGVPLMSVLLILSSLPAPPAPADTQSAAKLGGRGPTADEERAVQLLARAEEAPGSVPYSGVQFASSWSRRGTASLVAEVRHWPAKGTAVRIRSSSGGVGGEVFQGDPGDASGGVAQAGSGPLGLIARNYDVVLEAPGSVAGRPADVVVANRADGSLAARFWLDSATGLLLRREVYDSRGATVRASAFVDITVGDVASAGHVPPMFPGRPSKKLSTARLGELRSAGWEVRGQLPLGLHLYDAREIAGTAGPIVHLSYSDGLSTVSLFQQRGHLDQDKLGGYQEESLGPVRVYVRAGVPLRLTWSAGGTVYSVLADAPDETVEAVVAALPHAEESDGFLSRVRRGLGRFVSWLNPFE